MNQLYRTLVKTFVFAALHLFSLTTYAQQKPASNHKVFVAKDGDLYWNKKLPVYIRLAASPDDTAKTYLLKSKITPKYADPFFFDSEGPNFIRTRWAVDKKTGETIEPKIEVTWQVHNDSKPPLSRISFNKAKYIKKDGRYYFNDKLRLTIAGEDQMSGVDKIYVSMNGQDYVPYSDTLVFEEAGDYTMKFYAVDNVGNEEPLETRNFILDKTAPVTEVTIKGDVNENVLSTRSYLQLKSTDETGVNGIYYSIDENKKQVYNGSINISSLEEGSHVLRYYAIDEIGNKEESHDFEFYLDKHPPLITLEAMGDRYVANGKEFSSGRTRIKLTAIDNKAGVKEIWYSVNGGTYQLFEKPFYLSGKAGNSTIRFYALDFVNNKNYNADAASKNVSAPYLDLTGPKVGHDLKGVYFKSRDTIFISPKTKIELNASDNESGLQKITYKINGDEEKEYSGYFNIQEEGFYEITQYGTDNVNNINNTHFAFHVDANGPEIFPRFSTIPVGRHSYDSLQVDVYPVQTELYLAATDKLVGTQKIFYSLNNTPYKPYVSPLNGFEHNKKYMVQIKAIDWLGNTKEETLSFEIAKR